MQTPRKGTLYLHAGTHKTGTTSIQVFLAGNEALLASGGVLVPRTGRPIHQWGTALCGHHNVGWELGGISAFLPEDGSFDGLLQELRSSRAPVAIVSSEEFEYLHAKPAVLARMAAGFDDAGYEAKVVLYLRGQAGYMQSMYVEGAKAGYRRGMDYRRLMREIVDTGAYVPDPNMVLRFEYAPLIEGFAAGFGAGNVIVRAYRPGGGPHDLLKDFLAVVGERGLPPGNYTVPPPQNVSPSMLEVLAGMHTGALRDEPAAPGPLALIARHSPGTDPATFARRFDVMTRDETLSYLERFAPDNRRIEATWGARIPFIDPTDVPPRPADAEAAVAAQRALLDYALAAWGIG